MEVAAIPIRCHQALASSDAHFLRRGPTCHGITAHPETRASGDQSTATRRLTGTMAVVSALVASVRRRRVGGASGCPSSAAVTRLAFRWQISESNKHELEEAIKEVASQASSSAGGAGKFAVLCVPQQWAGQLSAASRQFKQAVGAPLSEVPVLAMQSSGSPSLRLGIACGCGDSRPFFVTKEDLTQAGAGLAKSSSAAVPGVPEGDHGSFLLFADPKVPGNLTRTLLEALDAKYPAAVKAGLVVTSAKPAAEQASAEDDWEPTRDRQLRPRDRTDGHGWIKGDPGFDSTKSERIVETLSAEFKRRPFGVKRYSPGVGGKGAMVLEMQEKERYKGDAMGQVSVKGVKTGMILKTIQGIDVSGWDFEDIMDLIDDKGIVDPDSISASTWGDAAKARNREPVQAAELPLSVEFMIMSEGSGSSMAPLSLDGNSKREGVLGVALPNGASSVLDLCGSVPFSPVLEVNKAGTANQGLFAVSTVTVGSKAMPAAAALNGFAKSASLDKQSFKRVAVGLPRTGQPGRQGVDSLAAEWALFPLAGTTSEGGLVLRTKGPEAEGLGSDSELKSARLFRPTADTVVSLQARLGHEDPNSVVAFVTQPELLQGSQSFGIAGAAVIGAAGASGTTLHRQSAHLVCLKGE